VTEDRKHTLSEQDFEAYLDGRSSVSRSYARLRELEPPAALDRSVLEQARSAVRRRPGRPTFWSHWSTRVAAAAVVVLAVGVALQFRTAPLTGDEPAGAPRGPAAGRQVEHLDWATRNAAVPEARTPIEIKRRSAAAETARSDNDHPARTAADSDAGRGLATSATASGPEPPLPASRRREAIPHQFNVGARRDASETGEPGPEAPRFPPASTPADDAAGATTTPELESVRPVVRDEPADDGEEAQVSEAARAIDEAQASEETRATEEARKRALLAAYRKSELNRPKALLAVFPTAPWRDDPETWLKLVDALLEEGDEDAARRELEDFVEAWPDYTLGPRYESWLAEEGGP